MVLGTLFCSACPIEADEVFSLVAALYDDQSLARAHDVELSGDFAFVPGKDQSLAVVHIGDPENPKVVWYQNDDSLTDAETVLPIGDTLLVGTKDFHLFSISTPSRPELLGTVSDRQAVDKINGMILMDSLAFAACKNGRVNAFDFSDRDAPSLYASIRTDDSMGLIYPHDIDQSGDYIVIVDPAQFLPPEGRLGVIRVRRNGEFLPIEAWSLTGKTSGPELIGANRVQVHGTYALVGGSLSPEGRSLASKTGKSLVNSKMSVVQLVDPENPRIVASVEFPDLRGPNGLTVAGDVVFCAGGQTIAAYSIQDPEKPYLLTHASFAPQRPLSREDNYHDLVFRDGLLYVSAQSENGFLIFRVNDPELLRLAKQ